MENKIKVLLADDHQVVRAGIASILNNETDIQVVGEARDGQEAVDKALCFKPDVIIMDIQMPRLSGLEAIKIIKEHLSTVQIIIFTISENEEDLFQALLLGAQGYLLKSVNIFEVADAVRRTAMGEAMLSPKLAAMMVAEFRQNHRDNIKLSDREQQVLDLVSQGLSNIEISRRLFVTESTVRTHLQRLLDKLHLQNRAAAISYAAFHHFPRLVS